MLNHYEFPFSWIFFLDEPTHMYNPCNAARKIVPLAVVFQASFINRFIEEYPLKYELVRNPDDMDLTYGLRHPPVFLLYKQNL